MQISEHFKIVRLSQGEYGGDTPEDDESFLSRILSVAEVNRGTGYKMVSLAFGTEGEAILLFERR